MKKYYFAYDERYKKVHEEGLLWFSDKPTSELLEWVQSKCIPPEEEICEIGCGEGKDALWLSQQGYRLTAVDASPAAIDKCRQLAMEKNLAVDWMAGDALDLSQSMNKQFKWAYSIATLHMLVEDEDRQQFLKSMYELLEPDGRALLVSMGDGENQRSTDTTTAFELQERHHAGTGRTMLLAATSYRAINWEDHEKELINAGFLIENKRNTENEEYFKCMTVYLRKGK